ncbi:hypothetical protein [Nonomuraea dietziae]|uniref:hypothetical protein n=1 Tax=Nonomuraea dietziae TaxID=65515 RepID=UPI00341CD2E1
MTTWRIRLGSSGTAGCNGSWAFSPLPQAARPSARAAIATLDVVVGAPRRAADRRGRLGHYRWLLQNLDKLPVAEQISARIEAARTALAAAAGVVGGPLEGGGGAYPR